MIRLYDRKETDFTTNGLRILQPIACAVTEEINGDYSLQITMPTWDTKIQNESIIKAPTPHGDQLFRIYDAEIDALGDNVYYARHIFYDLLDDFIEDLRPTNATGAEALAVILSGTGFTGESDITTKSTAYYEMMDPVTAILGGQSNDDNAFINRWGGELERDNYTVRMKYHLGADRGVSIRYRKNLTGLTVETNMDSVVTRIYPTGRAAGGQTLLTLPEKYVDSPYVDSYVRPKISRVDYSDIEVGDDMTQEEAYDALRTAAQAEFANGLDKPKLSAKVEFVPLEATEEYKGIAALEKVYLGDTIHVYHEPLGIHLDTEVVKYEYDCLTQRYNSIELGTPAVTIGAMGSVVQAAIQNAKEEAKTAAKDYSAGVQQLNNLMANALGFYKTEQKQPDGSSIYYLHNKPKLADSNIIWKWTVDGFAWTTDGHTWQNGITADGNLVIKTISAIGIIANWIVAGLLRSENGRVYFDLDGNEAAVSKLISATNEATDVYADIGKIIWADGGTSKGMSLHSGDGTLVSFAQKVADAFGAVGLDLFANGDLSIRSGALASSQNNMINLSTNSAKQGTITVRRANGSSTTSTIEADNDHTAVFTPNGDAAVKAFNDETDVVSGSTVNLSAGGGVRIKLDSSGIYFYAGGSQFAHIDVGTGWSGRLNGASGINFSTAVQGSDGSMVHLRFDSGLLTEYSHS